MSTKLWLMVTAVVATGLAVAGMAIVPGWVGTNGSPSSGTLAVAVHDAPCTNCSHVWMTFQTGAVHESNSSGNGWMALNVTPATVDLMALNGTAFAKVIGVASLSTGHYEMIRLNVSQVVVGLDDGTNVTATLASSQAFVHGQFVVATGMTTTVSVDIDLASSLHLVTVGGTVEAIFTPDIGAVTVTTTG